ncbi:MAG: hypothetical protein ACFE8U_08135, partial [Candidatus Hermodarchaeota archaeon]
KYNGSSVAQKCFVDEDLLYVPCGETGVDIVDISNPERPEKIGLYSDNSGAAFSLDVKDNIAYVADGPDGLEIIELTIEENNKEVHGFTFIGCIITIPFIIKGVKRYKRNK